VKAGTYYIGDLCYVMHDRWDEVCGLLFEDRETVNGEFTLKEDGIEFASYNTMYGDGEYYDQLGNSYPVDAGLIGCIRVNDISPNERENISSGNIVTFDHDFDTSSNHGMISFGHIVIDTAEEYTEENF